MKKKNVASKFLEGALAGVALGVAASMFLSSRKGKKVKNDIVGITADFYKYISPKVKKLNKMGEGEYKEFMKSAAGQYIKTKKISGGFAKQLIKEAQQSWKHLAKHLGK